MYMSKSQYHYVLRTGVSKVTRANAVSAGFRTAKEASDAIRLYNHKRAQRAALRLSDPLERAAYQGCTDRMLSHFERRANDFFVRSITPPAHYDLSVSYGFELGVSVRSYFDNDGYARSCCYPMRRYCVTFRIPRGGLCVDEYDGLPMIICRRQHLGALTRIDGFLLVRGRSYDDMHFTPTTVVTNGLVCAHGCTPQDALKAFRRKLRARIKCAVYRTDDIIGARDYMRVTGACEYGTRAFCSARGLDFDTARMTVGDVLALTRDAYGHDALSKVTI